MSYWKMGVGLPMTNNSFGFGTRVYAKCDPPYIITPQGGQGQYTMLGTSSFYYDEDYGTAVGMSDRLTQFLRAGDRIRIGPSSYPGYEGAFQDFEVSNVTYLSIQCTSGTNVIFTVGDPILAVGTNCPGGWIPETSGALTMGGITAHTLSTLPTSPGYLDRHSVQIEGAAAGNSSIRWDFELDDYIPSTRYKTGFWYQLSGGGGGSLQTTTIANVTTLCTATASTNVSEWTEVNGPTPNLSPSLPGSAFFTRIFLTGVSGSRVANIDHLYVEHASQTDGSGSGVYIFDDYPALGSRQFKTLEPSKYFRLANKRLVRNSVGNDTYKRYMVSASFKDVSTTLRDNLEVFTDWQDLGSPLVLHHDIPSVPPNLYGIMTIKDTAMGHWSGGVCSFSIDFEEM